jgi:hypothetical protein
MGRAMTVSARLRYEVLRRDEFACRYCRRTDLALEVDHVVPVALGGADLPENLVAACEECNGGKSATGASEELVADVDSRAAEWAAAMRRAAELQSKQVAQAAEYREGFDAIWSSWAYEDGTAVSRPTTWASTVAGWHAAGLELSVLEDLAHQVLPRSSVPDHRKFAYYCGAARNVLRERAAIAQALLQEGDPTRGKYADYNKALQR